MNKETILKGTGTYTGKDFKYDTYNIAVDQIDNKVHVCILHKDEEKLFTYSNIKDFLLEWKNVNVYSKMITVVPKSFYALYEHIKTHK